MCVIIINESNNRRLSERMVDQAIKKNPHGYGMIDLTTGEVFRTNKDELAKKKAMSAGKAIHHFRLASVGGIAEKNIHPFAIDDQEFLFMNGTVRDIITGTGQTDTEAFAQMLSNVEPGQRTNVLRYWSARFAIANIKLGTVEVSGSWFRQGDLLMSNDSVLEPVALAVYGTLKKGYHNHGRLNGGKLIDKGFTMGLHRMPSADYVPRVYKGPAEDGSGHQIRVEVYEIEASTLKNSIDSLEGHPTNYRREVEEIRLDSGKVIKAYMYFSASSYFQLNASEKLISEWEGKKFDVHVPSAHSYSRDDYGNWRTQIMKPIHGFKVYRPMQDPLIHGKGKKNKHKDRAVQEVVKASQRIGSLCSNCGMGYLEWNYMTLQVECEICQHTH